MAYVLKTTDLCKTYGSKKVTDNVSMTIKEGTIYGLIGKNGAGKTTIMRQILGMALPTKGEIELFDGMDLHQARKQIGCLIEAPAIYKKCTAYENMKRMAVLLGCSNNEIISLLEFVGLGKTGNKQAGQFSLGMRQRLGIGMALLGNPKFLILDEPINGLDPEGIIEVRHLIEKLNKEKNITFMISSHLLEELSKIATHYGFISEGRLIEDISAEQLKINCQDRIKIVVDDTNKASGLLETMCKKDDIHIYNSTLYVDSNLDKTAEINKMLIQNGVMVSELTLHALSLEDYFLRKVGASNE